MSNRRAFPMDTQLYQHADLSPDLAVVVVIDSSVKTAESWSNHICDEYLVPILKQLRTEAGTRRVSVAQVTYGRSSKSPDDPDVPVILSQEPFSSEDQIVSRMKNHPYDLGIGRTANRSESGMAVLEGMMTALELIDDLTLPTATRGPSKTRSHIILIASYPAEASPATARRGSEVVSWGTLPHALHQRKANISVILTSQNKMIQQLYASTVAYEQILKPWFPVNLPDIVLLSALNDPAFRETMVSPQRAGVKRARGGDDQAKSNAATTASPRSKRARPTPKSLDAALPSTEGSYSGRHPGMPYPGGDSGQQGSAQTLSVPNRPSQQQYADPSVYKADPYNLGPSSSGSKTNPRDDAFTSATDLTQQSGIGLPDVYPPNSNPVYQANTSLEASSSSQSAPPPHMYAPYVRLGVNLDHQMQMSAGAGAAYGYPESGDAGTGNGAIGNRNRGTVATTNPSSTALLPEQIQAGGSSAPLATSRLYAKLRPEMTSSSYEVTAQPQPQSQQQTEYTTPSPALQPLPLLLEPSQLQQQLEFEFPGFDDEYLYNLLANEPNLPSDSTSQLDPNTQSSPNLQTTISPLVNQFSTLNSLNSDELHEMQFPVDGGYDVGFGVGAQAGTGTGQSDLSFEQSLYQLVTAGQAQDQAQDQDQGQGAEGVNGELALDELTRTAAEADSEYQEQTESMMAPTPRQTTDGPPTPLPAASSSAAAAVSSPSPSTGSTTSSNASKTSGLLGELKIPAQGHVDDHTQMSILGMILEHGGQHKAAQRLAKLTKGRKLAPPTAAVAQAATVPTTGNMAQGTHALNAHSPAEAQANHPPQSQAPAQVQSQSLPNPSHLPQQQQQQPHQPLPQTQVPSQYHLQVQASTPSYHSPQHPHLPAPPTLPSSSSNFSMQAALTPQGPSMPQVVPLSEMSVPNMEWTGHIVCNFDDAQPIEFAVTTNSPPGRIFDMHLEAWPPNPLVLRTESLTGPMDIALLYERLQANGTPICWLCPNYEAANGDHRRQLSFESGYVRLADRLLEQKCAVRILFNVEGGPPNTGILLFPWHQRVVQGSHRLLCALFANSEVPNLGQPVQRPFLASYNTAPQLAPRNPSRSDDRSPGSSTNAYPLPDMMQQQQLMYAQQQHQQHHAYYPNTHMQPQSIPPLPSSSSSILYDQQFPPSLTYQQQQTYQQPQPQQYTPPPAPRQVSAQHYRTQQLSSPHQPSPPSHLNSDIGGSNSRSTSNPYGNVGLGSPARAVLPFGPIGNGPMSSPPRRARDFSPDPLQDGGMGLLGHGLTPRDGHGSSPESSPQRNASGSSAHGSHYNYTYPPEAMAMPGQRIASSAEMLQGMNRGPSGQHSYSPRE